jgi:hypothetical protein
MKRLLLFALIPIITLAQGKSYPDTIIAHHSKVYPCRILQISPDGFKLVYGANQQTVFSIRIAKSIMVESFGTVYDREDGFKTALGPVQDYINERNKIYFELNRMDSLAAIPAVKTSKTEGDSSSFFDEVGSNNSFGFFYSPLVQGKRVTLLRSYYNESEYTIIDEFSTIVESQFTTKLVDKMYLIFNVAYNASTTKTRSENHQVDFDPIGQADSGSDQLSSLKIFTIETGLKYYFNNFIPRQTRIYLSAGIGKKLAFVENKNKELFKDEPPNDERKETDNLDQFLEGLNSPFLLQLGFGAEYYFNKSLSVHSSIRFYYASISANRKQTELNEYREIKRTVKYESDEINTHIGLGLNFYF